MVEVERDNTRGIATGGLTTGIIGTTLGAMNSGILPNLFGGNAGGISDNMAVNRYELSMIRELTNKDMEIAYLKGREAAKGDSQELYNYINSEIRRIDREQADQRVFNATTSATVSCLTGQVNGMQALLNSITKTVVPNSAICPGWGDVAVTITPASTTTAGA